MQEHQHSVDIEASPEELWRLFWYRGPRPQADGDVRIDILHPGDETGEGLVRHCTFRVPKYLCSGGRGQSWEWLTDVRPHESWRYDAIGKPLWSQAHGFTRFEDLGDGRTRVHFTESYHAFNPVMRLLLEKRVHRFISGDNDRLIESTLQKGVRWMRKQAAQDGGPPSAPAGEPGPLGEPGPAHDPGQP